MAPTADAALAAASSGAPVLPPEQAPTPTSTTIPTDTAVPATPAEAAPPTAPPVAETPGASPTAAVKAVIASWAQQVRAIQRINSPLAAPAGTDAVSAADVRRAATTWIATLHRLHQAADERDFFSGVPLATQL